MTAAVSESDIAALRHRRRELRREVARVRWWRELVAARRALTVAYLADATTSDPDLDTSWEALVADAPTTDEVAGAVWPAEGDLPDGAIDRLDEITRRLKSYESRLSASLEHVTTHMVEAMSSARSMEDTRAL